MTRWIAVGGLLFAAVSASAADGFKVVVNEARGMSSLPRAQVSAMLLKKVSEWSDGTPVAPVDQAAASAVRQKFSSRVHGKEAAAVKSYWQQQIFAGRGVPPVEMASDDQVLAYVRSHPGAIGYVSDAAATDGVKVLTVE
jgi:ABC-type phosphate transport system substrate-binding protein